MVYWTPFVQFGVGGAVAKTLFIENTPSTVIDSEEWEWGYSLSLGVGLIGTVYRSVGLIAQIAYIYAPTITNLYDEHHNSGGLSFTGGVRITL